MSKPERLAAIAGVVVLGFALTGCTSKATVTNQPAETSGITVAGHGEVEVPPDIGFVTIGVQATATTVAAARDQAASSADSVIRSIKKGGVADKDIQTSGLSIQPNYDYTRSSPRLTGYTVSNTVTAKVRKVEDMSKVVDDAIAAGGDTIRLQSVRFGVEDEAKAKSEARKNAMDDAKARAEELAKLGGVSLGAPLTISETQSSGGGPLRTDTGAVPGGSVATPIETGTNTVTVDVTVRWSLK